MSGFQFSQDVRVREILKIYRRVEKLHPIASEIFASPGLERMFWTSLTHDLHVIRRRSQNLADGDITPVQKSFRILMEEKTDGNAAIEIYMDEILGLKIVPEGDRALILAQAIQTRDYILNHSQGGRNPSSTAAYENQPVPPISSIQHIQTYDNAHNFHGRTDTSEDLFVSDTSEPCQLSNRPHSTVEPSSGLSAEDKSNEPLRNPAAGEAKNEMLRKLFVTYQRAKNDFHATPVRSLERTKSAKFLRDTTENCINYIASTQHSPTAEGLINTNIELAGGQATLDEMHSTLQEAKTTAEAGSGGKKRRFDDDWTNVPEGPAEMRPSSVIKSLGNRDPIPRGQTSGHKLGNHSVHRRTGKYPRRVSQSERSPQDQYPASAGRDTRRVYPLPIIHQEKQPSDSPVRYHKPNPSLGYSDCYRPAYR